MDKKFICAVILVILVFAMCSCSDNVENSDSQSMSLSQTNDNVFVVYANSGLLRMEDYEPNSFLMVSCAKDNVQLLNYSDSESDKNIHEKYPIGDMENTVLAQNYYTTSSTNYNSLAEEDIIIKYHGIPTAPLAKVEYINYEETGAEPRHNWIEYFEKKLEGYDTPLVISESWSTEYNGKRIDIVSASNICQSQQYLVDDLNYDNGKFAIYRFVAVFIDDTFISDIGRTDLIREISAIEAENNSIIFITNRIDYDLMYVYSAYQFNNKGDKVSVPIYLNTGVPGANQALIYLYPDRYLIFDFDNDGEMEILQRLYGPGSLYYRLNLYEIDDEDIILSSNIYCG